MYPEKPSYIVDMRVLLQDVISIGKAAILTKLQRTYTLEDDIIVERSAINSVMMDINDINEINQQNDDIDIISDGKQEHKVEPIAEIVTITSNIDDINVNNDSSNKEIDTVSQKPEDK